MSGRKVQGVMLDEKPKKVKRPTTKASTWKYLDSAGYQDSLDREFGKQKRTRSRE